MIYCQRHLLTAWPRLCYIFNRKSPKSTYLYIKGNNINGWKGSSNDNFPHYLKYHTHARRSNSQEAIEDRYVINIADRHIIASHISPTYRSFIVSRVQKPITDEEGNLDDTHPICIKTKMCEWMRHINFSSSGSAIMFYHLEHLRKSFPKHMIIIHIITTQQTSKSQDL